MALVILILGLIAAGVYTENSGFYVAAGIAGAFWVLFVAFVGSKVRAIKKSIDKDFGEWKFTRKF